MGQLVSMAFLQGASGLYMFSSSVHNYISGMQVGDIVVCANEIADPRIQSCYTSRVFKMMQTFTNFVTLLLDYAEYY